MTAKCKIFVTVIKQLTVVSSVYRQKCYNLKNYCHNGEKGKYFFRTKNA